MTSNVIPAEVGYPLEIAEAHASIIRAAIKLHDNADDHLSHDAAGCIGPLSRDHCECGLSDLRWAIHRLEKLKSQVHMRTAPGSLT